jgi:hypothetical protein
VYGLGMGEINHDALTKIARKTNGDFMIAKNSFQLTDLYNTVLSNYYHFFDQAKANTSRLLVKSHPAGKPVYFNGNLMKHKTPLMAENLAPGFYEVAVEFDRGTWECSAELEAGYTGIINARENDLGRDVAVISDVKSAMVFIDDNFVGYTSKYPFVAKTVKTGWFRKTKKFNFDKQLIIENIPAGNHQIKIIGLAEVENFFQPLETTIFINDKDIIINAEFLQNRIESKETNKILRDSKTNSPYDKVEDIFEELD